MENSYFNNISQYCCEINAALVRMRDLFYFKNIELYHIEVRKFFDIYFR